MVQVLIGDMFATQKHTLVNTVNCVGVMGKGVAEVFKKNYPSMFVDYRNRCAQGLVKLGEPYLYEDVLGISILNFPTKGHWRSPSRLEDIVSGLDYFVAHYEVWGIRSIAFPPLGCGNGGLDWADVGPLMYQKLSPLDLDVSIFAPFGTPNKQLTQDFLSQYTSKNSLEIGKRLKNPDSNWLALLEIVKRLQEQPYTPPVGRVIFQKICYIFTEMGVETGFQFKQGQYGPFSEQVKGALSAFANNNLISEFQLGRMNALKVTPSYDELTPEFDAGIEKKIAKTVDLFSRIKSTEQAEEVATIIYTARKIKADRNDLSVSEDDIFQYILTWKKHWNTPEKQISIANSIRNLEMLEWLKLAYSSSMHSELVEDF